MVPVSGRFSSVRSAANLPVDGLSCCAYRSNMSSGLHCWYVSSIFREVLKPHRSPRRPLCAFFFWPMPRAGFSERSQQARREARRRADFEPGARPRPPTTPPAFVGCFFCTPCTGRQPAPGMGCGWIIRGVFTCKTLHLGGFSDGVKMPGRAGRPRWHAKEEKTRVFGRAGGAWAGY